MPDGRMKWLLPIGILGGAALLAAAVITLAPEPETREAPEVLPVVEVVAAEPTTVRLDVTAQGTVQAVTETTLVAQVAGELVQAGSGLASGALVREGEMLARIDPRDYRLAVTRSEAAVAQARLGLELEQARAQVAREEWQSLGRGEAPPLAAREPQIAEARAAVDAAEAALEQARLNLARTTVRAPYNARVRDKLADRGQYLAPGTPVARLVAIDRAEIPLAVAQDELRFLGADLSRDDELSIPVELTLAGVGRWQAQVVRAGGEIHPRTRMMTLTAVVEDPLALTHDRAALPLGSFVDATIRGREARDVIPLPRAALRGADRVLVVDAEDRLRFRQVDVLRLEAERMLIHSGLTAGEQVCVSPIEAPVDGMKVRIAADLPDQTPPEPRP